MTVLEFTIGVKTSNPLNGQTGNTRLAGIFRSRERKKQRKLALDATLAHMRANRLRAESLWPCKVTLTRVSAGVMDGDGLAASQKGVRDGIADALELDDGDPRVQWAYAQRKGPMKAYAVHVTIERIRE